MASRPTCWASRKGVQHGLDEFFRTRIFQPLKMTHLPKEKTPRLAAVYTATRGGPVRRADGRWGGGQGDYVEGPRLAFSGGGGLLSTARDYGRLLQMMLNGGELDGVRLLGPKTIELMTTNHVGMMYQHPGIGELGFGYGLELTLDVGRAHHTGSPGDFGYRSAYFSRYFGSRNSCTRSSWRSSPTTAARRICTRSSGPSSTRHSSVLGLRLRRTAALVDAWYAEKLVARGGWQINTLPVRRSGAGHVRGSSAHCASPPRDHSPGCKGRRTWCSE